MTAQAQLSQAWITERLGEAGNAYSGQQFSHAETILRDIIARAPKASGKPYFLLGLACLRQGKREEGFAQLERLLDMKNGNIDWLATMGEVHQLNGDLQGALEIFRFCVQKMPDGFPEPFNRIYESGLIKTNNTPFPLRRRARFYRMAQTLESCLGLEGDMAECGCFRGFSAFIICSYAKAYNPAFDGTGMHIFDSFEGLSAPTADDAIDAERPDARRLQAMCRPGVFKSDGDTVRAHLSDFPGIEFIRGWLPQSLEGLPERRYKFVNVDVDLYEPTKGAFNYFYPRLVKGGAIISDDYGWPGAKKAIDEFCAAFNLTPELTEHQQAIVRKPA